MTTYFAITIAEPPGDWWVRLPTAKPKRRSLRITLRGKDEALADWAAITALELLGTETDDERVRDYAENLAGLEVAARERGTYLKYVQLPDAAEVPAANVEVSVFRTSRTYPELTLDTLEELYGKQGTKTVSLKTSRVELPAGPAVRLHRTWRGGDGPSDTVVSVTYVCRPPEIQNAVVYTMYWITGSDDDKRTECADTLAATLRITVDR